MSKKTKPTGYWTFFCNPAVWAIDDFLASDIDEDDYTVTAWQKDWFAPDQLGVIRVGIDHRTKQQLAGKPKLKPGIYAIVQVLSTAVTRPVKDDSYWLTYYPKHGDRNAVDIRYLIKLLDQPILLDHLKSVDDAYDQYLIDGFQAATMPLRENTFNYILSIAGVTDLIPAAIQLESANTYEEIAQLDLKSYNAAPIVREVISKCIERGSGAIKIKKIYQYRCLICEQLGKDPFSFQKKDGEPYIEAHHIIQVAEATPGVLGPTNIITVCANHHRQLHFGDVEILDNTQSHLCLRLDADTVRIEKLDFE